MAYTVARAANTYCLIYEVEKEFPGKLFKVREKTKQLENPAELEVARQQVFLRNSLPEVLALAINMAALIPSPGMLWPL